MFVSPANSNVEAITPSVVIFGDGASKKIINIK
jgi:hypothetical protein